MTIAEHLSVFVAIVIGLAFSTLAMNLHRLLVAGRAVKWDWLTPLLAIFMLFVTVSYWWASFYWHAKAEALTIGQFIPDLINLMLFFLAVAAVLPEHVPEEGLNLRAFYFERARYVWALMVLTVLVAGLTNAVRNPAGTSAHDWIVGVGLNIACAALFALLTVSKRVWLHGAVLVIALAVSIGINLGQTIGG
jgi:hypothetical protein